MAGDDVPPPPPPSNPGNSDNSKSDISNPFFTHHSDHPGLVLVSKPLNGDNYTGWKRAMTLALNSKNKLGFVNGSIKAPSAAADPEGYATWSRCNDMVHSWIVNTVSSEISDSIIYYPTAHEVWEDLRERFSQGNAPRIFEIQRDIASHRQEQQSISAYYTKLKSLWDELASYSEAPQGTQADQQKLMQFLMGLNETYSAIRGQILLMNPLPSIRQAYAAVAQEEKQRFIVSSHTAAESSSSTAAMAVRSSGRPNQTGSRGGRGDRPTFQTGRDAERGFTTRFGSGRGRGRPHCTYCGDTGHWVQTCFHLIGFPPGHPKARQGSGNFPKKNTAAPVAPFANQVTATGIVEEENGSAITLSESQFKQFLAAALQQAQKPIPNTGSSSKANAVTQPGSGFEEDDWFG